MMNRRQMLQGLAAGGGLSLIARSLATGLPVSFLLNPTRARADVNLPATSVLMVLDVDGDPLNANCPGSYVNGVKHAAEFAGQPLMLGKVATTAAQPWADLPAALRARMGFVHYATKAVAHNQFSTVLKLNRAAKNVTGNGEEMFPTLLAQELFVEGTHIQREPLSLGTTALSARGNPLPIYTPDSLATLFSTTGSAASVLDEFATVREKTLASLYGKLKTDGTPAQKAFVDSYLLSRTEAASLGKELGDMLDKMPAEDDDGFNYSAQIFAALALLQTRITPVAAVWVPFGGDNHHDLGLGIEVEQTRLGVKAIQYAWEKSHDPMFPALNNHLTFCTFNTFGRTLGSDQGRQHNPNHHVMALFGPNVKPGVFGAPQPMAGGKDFGAAPFDPTSGAVVSAGSGGVEPEDSLPVAGRTLAALAGVTSERLDKRIPNTGLAHKIIDGLVAS